MKKSKKIILGIALVLLAGIYYYIALPAVNIHSSDTWFFFSSCWWSSRLLMPRENGWGEGRSESPVL